MSQDIKGISRRNFLASVAATGLLVGVGERAAKAQSGQTPRKGGRLRVGLSAGSAKDSLDAKHALTEADIARHDATVASETPAAIAPVAEVRPAEVRSAEQYLDADLRKDAKAS